MRDTTMPATRTTTGDDLTDITADIRLHMKIVIDLAQHLASTRPYSKEAETAKDLSDCLGDLMKDYVEGGLEFLIGRYAELEDSPAVLAARNRHDAARMVA
jgi:hypothetical protein